MLPCHLRAGNRDGSGGMTTCDGCGNDDEMAFTVRTHAGRDYTFDSIECAAHVVAPRCAHCRGCHRRVGPGADAMTGVASEPRVSR